MELDSFPRYPLEEWTALVEGCGGNPIHLPQVHFAEWPDDQLRFLVYRAGGRVVACGPAFLNTGRRGFALSRTRSLELPTPPARSGGSPGERREIYEGLIAHCLEAGCRRLEIGHAWGDSLMDIEAMSGHVTNAVTEFVLDVEPDLEALLRGMHKNHRKNIHRAERRGLTIRAANTLEALLDLRRMQEAAADRRESRGDGFAVRDAGYFRRAHERVYSKGIGEVLLAFSGEECVGALAYLSTSRRAITVRSGCTAKGHEEYAMYLLHLALLKRAKERGWCEVNIGGVPAEAEAQDHPQHGLHEFKKGFGGRACLRTSVSMKVG